MNKEKVFITADTRESTTINGNIYRMNDKAEKIFSIDNKIIFISGYSSLSREVIEAFKLGTDHSIEKLQSILIEKGKLFEDTYPEYVDLLGVGYMDCTVITSVKTENKYQNILYNFNSTNHFEVLEYPIKRKEGYVFATAGILGQESTSIANSVKDKLKPVEVFKAIYNKLSCEAVGGDFHMYEFDKAKGIISHNTYKIEDSKELLNYEDYKHNEGHYILGNKLQIADDTGSFTIEGNLLTIKDQNKKTKVQLGEYTKGTYGLKLYGPMGDVVLDENGIVQVDSIQLAENVDSTHGLKLKFYVDDGMISIKKVKLNFTLERFRAYSKSIASGGGGSTTSSSGGGTNTSTQNGGYRATSTSDGGYHSDTTGSEYWNSGSSHNHGIREDTRLAVHNSSPHNAGSWVTWVPSGNHYHSFNVPSHSHEMVIPDHDHYFTVPDHSHYIDVPSHSHDIDYGIYESSYATGVRISIDGVIRGATYYNTENTVDVTQWITTVGWHTIELTSTQLGRINASLYMKSFVGF
jgi:hypothetical protein